MTISCHPLEGRFEDVPQLIGTSGRMLADNMEECFTLAWDPAAFPSCLIWIGNAGIPFQSGQLWHTRYRLPVEPLAKTHKAV